MTPRRLVATVALLVVVVVISGGCTSKGAGPVPVTDDTSAAIQSAPHHFDHAQLAAALPATTDLGWLPAGAIVTNDDDLTTRLQVFGCSAAAHELPSRPDSATNRGYRVGADTRAVVTFYDVETVEDAQLYLGGLRAFMRCPPAAAQPRTFQVVPLGQPTGCDDAIVLRTEQPVSQTIDAWCRVGNLISWIRLYPLADGTPPTDAQGLETVNVVGARLRQLFA